MDLITELKNEPTRPLWQTLENVAPEVAVKWASRFSPYECVSAQWALARAFESAWNVEVPLRAQYARAFFTEVQRILWSIDYFESLCSELNLGEETSDFYYFRENLCEVQDILGGNRVIPQPICIGGVDHDINVGQIKKFKHFFKSFEEVFTSAVTRIIQKKLKKPLTGYLELDKDFLERLGWGGPIAQASGSIWDLRLCGPYEIYRDRVRVRSFVNMKGRVIPSGDAFDRCNAVLFQTQLAFDLIQQFFLNSPDGAVRAELTTDQVKPFRHAYGAVEGSSGPIYAVIYEDSVRITSSSLRGRVGLKSLLAGFKKRERSLLLASLGYNAYEGGLSRAL